jgi:hypothetical protein
MLGVEEVIAGLGEGSVADVLYIILLHALLGFGVAWCIREMVALAW